MNDDIPQELITEFFIALRDTEARTTLELSAIGFVSDAERCAKEAAVAAFGTWMRLRGLRSVVAAADTGDNPGVPVLLQCGFERA